MASVTAENDTTWRCPKCGHVETQPPMAAEVYHPCGRGRVLRALTKQEEK